MLTTINHDGSTFQVDLSQPKDISIPIKSGKGSPVAWYIDPPEITPVVEGKWTALVREGAVINFQNIVDKEPDVIQLTLIPRSVYTMQREIIAATC